MLIRLSRQLPRTIPLKTRWLCLALLFLQGITGFTWAEENISYSRDVQPLLARSCFPCHGPEESGRQADLQLNLRDSAIQSAAIVPGKPDESELLRRVQSQDPSERMPPAESGNPLSAKQMELLEKWIAQGATYEPHWAFVAPSKPPLPKVRNTAWPANAIDHFVLAKLDKHNLKPSKESDRYTLVRRIYLDLIGLPPTPEEADAFVQDQSSDAYEKLVNQLLGSKHYGERWARVWLDLARYSDTNGYEKDRPRSIWPYRDWVIQALNEDMPYNRFTIMQLAGDLLPDATLQDRIATGFHRNTMLNEEGGIDPLEYRFYAMVDRVATTGLVWMGLTTGCAQCHSHKYDAISHTDYYRLMALLNNADEPEIPVKTPERIAKFNAIQARIDELTNNLKAEFPPAPAPGSGSLESRRKESLNQHFTRWLEKAAKSATLWTPVRPQKLSTNLPRLELLEDGSIFSSGDITKRDLYQLTFDLKEIEGELTAIRLEVLPDERLPAGGPGRAYYEGRKGDFFLSEFTATQNGQPLKFSSASQSYGKISIGSGTAEAKNVIDGNGSTGWSTAGREGEPHQLVLNLAKPVLATGNLKVELLFERHFAASLGRFRISVTAAKTPSKATPRPVPIERLIAIGPRRWSAEERTQILNYFLTSTPQLTAARKKIEHLKSQRPEYPTTLVFRERPPDHPRKTYRHHRGEYLSSREEVTPGVPAMFRPLPDDQPANRLTFARWLVSDRNPMASRLVVNRAWRSFFGQGLVRTNGDYGIQSDPPTHPELLDWLSCEFMENGWSLKSLHKKIVLSATYRQSSVQAGPSQSHDPQNDWLSRAPRYRVDAEVVRDSLLQASGLLSTKVGGPSVYPPQPASVTALAYGNQKWKPSQGEDRYRRSLYTFSKRTAPFAAYLTFNGPTGEACIVKRDRSTTPLQALTLLNDDMFLEMAQALAQEARKSKVEKQIATNIFRRLLTRPPSNDELEMLLKFHRHQKQRLAADAIDAAKIAGQPNASQDFAAWVMLARAVMNLDETITRH